MLNAQQEVAYNAAMNFALCPELPRSINTARRDDEFLISGLAGTGKTTTLVAVAEALLKAGLKIKVCTPTGKAAHVINSKQSVFSASTLHRALMERPIDRNVQVHKRLDELDKMSRDAELTPEEKQEEDNLFAILDSRGTDKLKWVAKSAEALAPECDFLIFDEASMIGQETHKDLIAHHTVRKLYFGDAAQLPPVQDRPAVDLSKADVKLTEIMRQDAECGILPVAHYVQKRKTWPPLKTLVQYDDIQIRKDNTAEMIAGFETSDHQILCWKNVTRHEVSRRVREARGVKMNKHYPYLPVEGEQIMIDDNDDDKRLLKGMLITLAHDSVYMPDDNPFVATIAGHDEKGTFRSFSISLTDLVEGYTMPFLANQPENRMMNWIRWADRKNIKVMWPYCLTVHKAQGSEWQRIVYLAEMTQGNPEWRKHAYTALTRAVKEVVICDFEFKHDRSAG